MTKELEKAMRHIETKTDAWAIKEIENALEQQFCDNMLSLKEVLDKLAQVDASDGTEPVFSIKRIKEILA